MRPTRGRGTADGHRQARSLSNTVVIQPNSAVEMGATHEMDLPSPEPTASRRQNGDDRHHGAVTEQSTPLGHRARSARERHPLHQRPTLPGIEVQRSLQAAPPHPVGERRILARPNLDLEHPRGDRARSLAARAAPTLTPIARDHGVDRHPRALAQRLGRVDGDVNDHLFARRLGGRHARAGRWRRAKWPRWVRCPPWWPLHRTLLRDRGGRNGLGVGDERRCLSQPFGSRCPSS